MAPEKTSAMTAWALADLEAAQAVSARLISEYEAVRAVEAETPSQQLGAAAQGLTPLQIMLALGCAGLPGIDLDQVPESKVGAVHHALLAAATPSGFVSAAGPLS